MITSEIDRTIDCVFAGDYDNSLLNPKVRNLRSKLSFEKADNFLKFSNLSWQFVSDLFSKNTKVKVNKNNRSSFERAKHSSINGIPLSVLLYKKEEE